MPADNLLGERGAGFAIAQDRLGPGRIHHCMRAIGSAERAFELMCQRAHEREAFGGKLAEKQFVQDFIAKSRMEIDSARLMVLHAAWKMDTEGKRAARQDISMIKVIAAQMHQEVLDRAMQVHGALGMSDDTPLALMWRTGRWLRVADGPDEVHKMVIAAARAEPAQAGRAGGGRGVSTMAPRRPRDFGLTDEQKDFVAAIRDFAAREKFEMPEEDHHSDDAAARLAELGWWGLNIDEEYGGSAGSFLDATLFLEETTRGQVPIGGLRRHADRRRRAEPLRHRGAEARPARAGGQGRRARDRDVRARLGLGRGVAQDAGAPGQRRVGAVGREDVVLLRAQGQPHPDRLPHGRGLGEARGPVDDLRAARRRGLHDHADQDAWAARRPTSSTSTTCACPRTRCSAPRATAGSS